MGFTIWVMGLRPGVFLQMSWSIFTINHPISEVANFDSYPNVFGSGSELYTDLQKFSWFVTYETEDSM